MNQTLNLYSAETRDEIIQKLKKKKKENERKKIQGITSRTSATLGT